MDLYFTELFFLQKDTKWTSKFNLKIIAKSQLFEIGVIQIELSCSLKREGLSLYH
jgi:hypothetical protein